MSNLNRRKFIRASSAVAAGCAADLTFLAQIAHAAASDTRVHPGEVVFGPETDRLLKLFRTTSREECVPAFAKEVKAGLSYRQFLAVLFLAAIENGDPHQVAQIYGAHRIGADVPIQERLLPLFWALNRVKQESEAGATPNSALKPLKGPLPPSDEAAHIFRAALLKSDGREAVRAAVVLARDRGARHVMHQLWEFAPRNVGDNLGHPAIALANSYRALETIGWQHAEIALRYVAGYIAGYKGDRTYAQNAERIQQTAARLPVDWAGGDTAHPATLDLYNLLRAGEADSSCELICSQLISKKAKTGSFWDAIHLAAADAIARHKTGGAMIGGQIHAVTTTNALRYGFDLVDDTRMKLINLLQAAGVICDFYIRHARKEGSLRDTNLLDLKASRTHTKHNAREVFELLPFKARDYIPSNGDDRATTDKACRLAFELLSDESNHSAFMRTARGFLCVKASLDPHDIKYPAAAFEDAHLVSSRWRPYVLASSVHALHGSKSRDTVVLAQVREALK